MATSDKDLALHEAAHAAVLWLVGWEHQLQHVELRGSGRKPPAQMVPAVQADMTLVPELRKYLVVLWAGTAATGNCDFDKDLEDMCEAVATHLDIPRVSALVPYGANPPEAFDLIEDGRKHALAIVGIADFRSLIDEIAMELLAAPKDASGFRILSAARITQLCSERFNREALPENIAGWLFGS